MLLATRNESVVKNSFLSLCLARTCLSLLNVMMSFLGTVVGIYEAVSNLGAVDDTSGLPLSGGHDGRCSCRHFLPGH